MLIKLKAENKSIQVQKVASQYLELRRDDKPGRWFKADEIELVIDPEN
jgi:hypothetical protein